MSVTYASPTEVSTSKAFKYRPHVDGLRAIAVLAVMFCHAGIGCAGGYVGVDVFFVISGFLITGLILKDVDAGQFQILKFWERRVLRILPASVVIVLLCFCVGWLLLIPTDFVHFAKSVIAQTMLASNVYFWSTCGYFDSAAELKPLLHTWSLAVEEQFYLLFPALLLLLSRLSRKYLGYAVLVLCALSLGLSVSWSYTHTTANYYLLPTRAWELGIGAFLATVPKWRAIKAWLAEVLSWAGFLAILFSVFAYNSETRFPGIATLLPCVGAFVIIWTNENSLTSVGKLLSLRPVVFIGLISYSLYLWHWPLFVFAKYAAFNPVPLSLRVLILIASFGLAVLSWKFVETPFRKRSVLQSRKGIFSFACVTAATLLLMASSIYKLQGFPARFPAAGLQYAKGSTDRAFINDMSLKDAVAGNFAELGSGDKQRPVDVFVWGDSHAMAVMPVLDRLCKERSVRGLAATHSEACPVIGYEMNVGSSLGKDTVPYNDAVLKFVRRSQIPNVVLVGYWDYYVNHGVPAAELRQGIRNVVDAVKDAGARVWILREVPGQPCNHVPEALAVAVKYRRGNPDEFGASLSDQSHAMQIQDDVFGEFASQPGVTMLDPTRLFAKSDGICRVAKNGKALYVDNSHLTVAGAMELRPVFEPIFDGIGSNQTPVGAHGDDVR